MPLRLCTPSTAAHWAVARRLVEAYAASLPVDLAFQSLDEELAQLSVHYAAPTGAFVLAEHDGEWIGCVGMRQFAESDCEMKRLYVSPTARGLGVGRALVAAIVERAREAGYQRMLLDTLPSMPEARTLYRSLGFQPIPPYRFNPVAGTAYLQLVL